MVDSDAIMVLPKMSSTVWSFHGKHVGIGKPRRLQSGVPNPDMTGDWDDHMPGWYMYMCMYLVFSTLHLG